MALGYNWQRALQGLSQGLMEAGGPQGWSAFGPGMIQGQQYYDQQQQQKTMDEMRQLQAQALQQEIEQQRTANTEKAAREKAINDLLGGGLMAPNGLSQAQFGGAPIQPGMMSGAFDPRQAAFLKAVGPDVAAPIIGEQLFKEPEALEAPKTRDILRGNQRVYQEYVNGSWQDVGSGPAFAPTKPDQPRVPQLRTLVSPKGDTITVRDDDPRLNDLLLNGYVERQASMFPAAPTGYQPTPTGLEPVPGGPADPERLTDTQRNEYKKQSLALNNLETAVDRYDTLIKQYGTMEFGATGRAELNNAYADLKIQMKEAANLGALTGPDIGVLQDMIIEPNSISGAWTGTKGTGKQITQMKAQIAQKRTNLDALYNPSSAMGQPDGQNGVIEWERDPTTGKARKKVRP